MAASLIINLFTLALSTFGIVVLWRMHNVHPKPRGWWVLIVILIANGILAVVRFALKLFA